MAWFDSGWGFATLMVFPLAGALVVALTQPKSEDLIKGVAFVTALSTFMLSVLAARRLSPADGEQIVFEPFLGAVPGLADKYYVTEFGIRLPILVLFGLIAVIVVIYSWKQWRKPSQAKALVMATLVLLDILMLELVFEEGTPPIATAGLLMFKNLHVARQLFTSDAGEPDAGEPDAGESCAATIGAAEQCRVSRGPGSQRPERCPGRTVGVFEEEMSGLVR